MATLYLMRHGQTLFNVLKRKQGWCDSPLTELGIEQAHRAGACLAERGVTFDHAYSSTSERAVDTLEVVLGELGCPDMPYERIKGLKEWNFGAFEGLTEDTNPPLPYGDFYVPFGGEGELAFRERIVATVTELMQRPGHECVLMASHGAAVAQFCALRVLRRSTACAATGGASATARSRSMSLTRPRRTLRRSSSSTPTRSAPS